MRSSSRAATVLALGCLGLIPVLAGCNAFIDQLGGSSYDGVEENIEAAIPGSDATVGSHLNGFSSDLDLVVSIPNATTATTDDLRTVVTALCDAEPRGFDHVRLFMQVGEPGSLDERSVDVDTLMSEAFPGDSGLGEYSLLEDLCAAQP